MHTLVYPLSGNAVTLHINRRAKKNIILRPHGKSSLHIIKSNSYDFHQYQT